MKKYTLPIIALIFSVIAFAAIFTNPNPPSVYAQANLVDPCQSSQIQKSSVAVNATSATTQQLVAPVAGQKVYVCGAAFTIAPSATTAATAQFITGTGATCGTSTVTNTGTFGNGDLTSAAPPVYVTFADPGTTFAGAIGAGLCLVSAGTAVSNQGVLTYIQM